MNPTSAIFRPTPPLVIGLLGGVASGKSTVAGLFANRGLLVLDADREARAVIQQADVLASVRARFGDAVFEANGAVDRAKLAALVFDDAAARRDLEALTHPAVRHALDRQLEAGLAAGQSVVLDVPLLLEGGLADRCDACVFVASTAETRQARARARGWGDAEVARREAHQADAATKRQRAAYTIDNDGSHAATERQVDALLATLAGCS